MANDVLDLVVLPMHPECWSYKYVSSYTVYGLMGITLRDSCMLHKHLSYEARDCSGSKAGPASPHYTERTFNLFTGPFGVPVESSFLPHVLTSEKQNRKNW